AAPEVPFACTKTLCVAWNARGVVIAHAATEEAARATCAVASLIVIDDATARDPCAASSGPAVITKRDLARYGAAAVTFEETTTGFLPTVEYSIERPYRPWHAERAYSRAARGLPPYQGRQGGEKGSHKKPPRREKQPHESGQPRAASAQ
ncbi:MAG: hypothetical protein J0H60_24245, partial [Rhizobiales bacterium]|nr:hypothetical protein [Hyphomicrobiales bacterium]